MTPLDPIFGNLLTDLPLRPPATVLQPERIGAAWPTSLSFAQLMLNRIQAGSWQIKLSQNRLDDNGVGEVLYTIDSGDQVFYFVIFSQQLSPEERTDRVIADGWDAAAALCEGELTPERLAELRRNVPRQEYGRADPHTLVWTRGNRSSRFFDYVVDQLAAGEQPDPSVLAKGGYIFRSTAYYGNTKFGLKSYRAFGTDHPLHGSFMPQMLAAFMFREYAADLAEHIAQAKSESAVPLAPEIRRYLGIGNATGMGMVPFVINHPHLTHTWSMIREIPLARAKQQMIDASHTDVGRFRGLLDHCITYFTQDTLDVSHTFAHREQLTTELTQIRAEISGWADWPERPWATLCSWAEATLSVETQELLHAILIQLYPEHTTDLPPYLDNIYQGEPNLIQSVAELQALIKTTYSWVFGTDVEQEKGDALFWYFSADSEEPLIGTKDETKGAWSARPLDIPLQVYKLHCDLQDRDPDQLIGSFLFDFPHHRAIIGRVQSTQSLRYAEIHTNLHHQDFIPLYTQRFQLAQYGMNRFNPQSIYWLRVTLLQGAPIASDVAQGEAPSSTFFPLPPI